MAIFDHKLSVITVGHCRKDKYDLPDIQIIDSAKKFDFFLWQPDRLYIVLGRSDTPEQAVNLAEADRVNACIVKRPSGGHTVVLSPRTIVISAIIRGDRLNGRKVFDLINRIIINALTDLGVEQARQRGISDIAIGQKKILGSSIYRRHTGHYFYHAVLNHSEDIDLIDRLLLHPRREPDYRRGRRHKEFVTSLTHEGYNLTISEIIWALKTRFLQTIEQ